MFEPCPDPLKKDRWSPSIPLDADNIEGESPFDRVKPMKELPPKFEDRTSVEDGSLPPEPLKEGSTTPASGKPNNKGPQLIGHLSVAQEEAMKTSSKSRPTTISMGHSGAVGRLGRACRAIASMIISSGVNDSRCIDVDSPWVACGDGSDCINRLTQVECLPDDCRCRASCQNQRFQQCEYAPIDIVQTEKKGFGLRAAEDLKKDSFIYEYVGDVISHPSFVKRMREYAEEGIRHFYFMMLQKDEYIDATKRGGIGRFANHSCNPNCYVAKWTVGDHVRMGIFANRLIKENEELTFNYNVDRYGHDAQPCYCGEVKCVGFIGGKTQTDLAAMDDLYLDALGISDEVDRLGLKGSKKKKSKKLDEDFVPILKPLLEKEAPKVIQAMRQTQSRKVLLKLLTRIKITEDLSALRQLMRLRAFSLMTNVMDDYAKDVEMQMLAVECMSALPLINRNKIEDSKVNIPVQACADSDNEVLKKAAQDLLDKWAILETVYRIPKRVKANGEEDDIPNSPVLYPPVETESRPAKRHKLDEYVEVSLNIKPLGFSTARSTVSTVRSTGPPPTFAQINWKSPPPNTSFKAPTRAEIAAIISAAAAAKEEEEKKAEEKAATEAAAAAHAGSSGDGMGKMDKEERERRRKERKEKEKKRRDEKEKNKEKRLLKLVGAVVVKFMSKYRAQMEVDTFKKHAKELTHIIAEKEKKSSSYKENTLDSLSDEKTAKIKKFARDYIHKALHKLQKAGKLRKRPPESSASGSASQANETPDRGEGALMSVEEAMDFSADEHSDDEDIKGDDIVDHDGDADVSPGQDERTPVEPAESDTSTAVATDPRKRGRSSGEPGKGPWGLVRDDDGDVMMDAVEQMGIVS
ncbi:hypothetical protein EW146_g6736 [Bondarzewia mesenterica]|uniref:Histone-lysine N-methyltransferase, H3 lysine-36 specific n=1 Tax=Bondarzewia mesenterica TaxID=1095465 RepID=A0A4S4LMP2_9AGAM|nr:hypothetical protein EW146_g6736 [Bondarzewia mesenterica]